MTGITPFNTNTTYHGSQLTYIVFSLSIGRLKRLRNEYRGRIVAPVTDNRPA